MFVSEPTINATSDGNTAIIIQILAKNFFLSHFDDHHMKSIQDTIIFSHHYTGNIIINQGDDGDSNSGSQIVLELNGYVGNKVQTHYIDFFFQLIGRG